jgi:hypothetical protein
VAVTGEAPQSISPEPVPQSKLVAVSAVVPMYGVTLYGVTAAPLPVAEPQETVAVFVPAVAETEEGGPRRRGDRVQVGPDIVDADEGRDPVRRKRHRATKQVIGGVGGVGEGEGEKPQ